MPAECIEGLDTSETRSVLTYLIGTQLESSRNVDPAKEERPVSWTVLLAFF